MTPNTTPIVPAPPSSYPAAPSTLNLFVPFPSRSAYIAAGFKDPGPLRQGELPRNWCDKSANPGYPSPGSYLVMGAQAGQPAQVLMAVPPNVGTPNFFEPYNFAPAPAPAPTVAMEIDANGQRLQGSVNPGKLSEKADAEALGQQLAAAGIVTGDLQDLSSQEWPLPIDWGDETRRAYGWTINNVPVIAGDMFQMQNAQGVYTDYTADQAGVQKPKPGQWGLGDQQSGNPGLPQYNFDPEPDWGAGAQFEPIPERPLKGEHFGTGPTPMSGIMVYSDAALAHSTGDKVYDLLLKVAQKLGVEV